MAAMVHQSLTNCQAIPRVAQPQRPGLFAQLAATLRQWRRNARERRELAALAERELHDMGVSSADVWNEISQPFWRTTRPF
jgi:uncharacterized protein YjiS (DUF1127 family)